MNAKKYLSIVLLETVSFERLISKISDTFNINLSCSNKKGRYIAEGYISNYKIEVIDKVDQLGEFLSDENYTLDFIMPMDNNLNYKEIEKTVKNRLKLSHIKWEYGIWSRDTFDEKIDKIYPNDD